MSKPNGKLKVAPLTEAQQHARFLETACALGCDKDEAAFTEKLKVIAQQKKLPSTQDHVTKSGDKSNKSRTPDDAAN